MITACGEGDVESTELSVHPRNRLVWGLHGLLTVRFLGVCVIVFAATSLAGDYSRVPMPSKRAYGRVRDQLLTPVSFQIKPVSWLKTKDRLGKVMDSAQVFALVVRGSDGQGFAAYFTTDRNTLASSIGIRQAAMKRGSSEYLKAMYPAGRRVPIGLTSAQMTFLNPKTNRLETKTYRDRVSLQLSLIPGRDQLLGQILLVLPDMNRSFVCGAFKAPLSQ